MTRSVWKGPFIDRFLLNKEMSPDSRPIRVYSRRSIILPQFVGIRFEIHNGKKFIPLKITEDMIGHKFGEFASTRQQAKHNTK